MSEEARQSSGGCVRGVAWRGVGQSADGAQHRRFPSATVDIAGVVLGP